MSTAEEIETGHQDRVTAVNVNFDGSKILTASIDHKVKVWAVDRTTGERQLLENFTAHDADIRDAKWLHPSTGTHLATIGNDLKFHLWQEDPHQAPRSGRRFRRVAFIQSKSHVPFVSLDFKNIDNVYTFLALIDRQGLLSIYEPTAPDEFKDWTLIDRFHVCTPPPGRGEQTCFKVRFDQNVTPLPYINCVSDDKRQLSLVVTAMNEVKIYRSVNMANQNDGHHAPPGGDRGGIGAGGVEPSGMPSSRSGGIDEASHRFMFYEAARLPVHPALIRDVQWAPFNIRGSDLFATACKDGAVRIFEMQVIENAETSRGSRQSVQNADGSAHSSSSTGAAAIASQSQPQTPKGGTFSGKNPNTRQPTTTYQSSLTSAITSRNQNVSGNASNLQTSSSGLSSGQTQTTVDQQQQQQQQSHDPTNPDTSSSSSSTTGGGGAGTDQQQQQSTTTTTATTHHPTSTTNPPPQKPLTTTTTTGRPSLRNTHPFPFTHKIHLQSTLSHAHTDCWSVTWEPTSAQILISNGADGITKMWRQGILDGYSRRQQQLDTGEEGGGGGGGGETAGRWMLFADQAVEIGSGGNARGSRREGNPNIPPGGDNNNDDEEDDSDFDD